MKIIASPAARLLSLWLLVFSAAGTVQASISACPPAPTVVPLSSTSNPQLSPADPANGCSVTNQVFSNFSVGAVTGVINGVTLVATNNGFQPAASDIFLTTAPAIGIELSSPLVRGANSSDCDNNNGPQDVGLAAFCISGKNQSLTSSINYQVTSAVLGGTIDMIGLSGTLVSHANVTTAVLFREICVGAVFTNFVGGSSGCSGAYGVLEVGSVQGNFTSLSQSNSVGFAPASVVGIRDTVFLQTFNGEGSFAEALAFDFATPEPATLGLVGVALACGAGASACRRRK